MDRNFLCLNQKQWTRLLFALVISVFGLLLRINMAIYGPIEADEPVYVDAAIQYSRDIRTGNWIDIINSDFNYEHPVFYKLVYGLVMPSPKSNNGVSMAYDTQIGDSDNFIRLLGLRLVSVIFGTLAVFILSLINPYAGFFLAINSFSVKYTSVIYLESLPLLLSGLSVITLNKMIESYLIQPGFTRSNLIYLGISAATLGLATASKYMYGIAGIAIVLYLIFLSISNKSFKILKMILVWVPIALLFFVLGNPVLWVDPIGHLIKSFGFNIIFSQANAGYPFYQPLIWLSLSIPQQTLIHVFQRPGNFLILLDALFLPLAIIGLLRMKRYFPVFTLWMLLGLLFLLIWKTKWPQYILLILFPYCLSASMGLEEIKSKGNTLLNVLWNKLSH